MTLCTCLWSLVNTTTIDPPYIVARDEDCPLHGEKTQPLVTSERALTELELELLEGDA